MTTSTHKEGQPEGTATEWEAGELTVRRFRCSAHGSINPVPKCPKCFITEKSRSYEEGVKDGETKTKNRAGRYMLGFQAGRESVRRVSKYAEHLTNCIRHTFCAGRPAEGGGYEEKFGDLWYRATPVDETPKCDCGLVDLLSKLDEARLEGNKPL